MKKCLIFLFFFGTSLFLNAQDTIFKKNKVRVLAKVILVGSDTVDFYRASMPEGPVYHLPKSDISYIKYENGKADYFEPQPSTPEKSQHDNSGVSILTNTETTKPFEKEAGLRIDVGRGGYYVNNRRISHRNVSRMLERQHNPMVDSYLHTSWNENAIGQVCSYSGLISSAIGGEVFLLGLVASGSGTASGPDVSGQVMTVGAILFVGGVTSNVIGAIQKKRSVASYLRAIQQYNDSIL